MDLEFLRPLYEQPGDVVSVYLDTSRDSEDAAHAVELRWRAARDRLAAAGAGAATLDAVAAVVTDPARAAPGRAVFARDGSVLLTEALGDRPRREIARLAPLPHVMPLLAQRAPHVPHLRVSARHDGGEIVAVSPAGPGPEEEVSGAGWPVHKTGKGGWSTLRYEHRVEETWEVNAKELAERVATEAGRIGAQLIVAGGDAQARTLLLDQLGSALAAITITVEQEVAADSAALARAADEAVAGYVAQRSRERFAHWRTQRAHDRGVASLATTMAALRDGAAAEVLLIDHPESTATAWIGPGGADLASSADELTQRGVAQPGTDRADAALARAVATTGAELWFLPEDLFLPAGAVTGELTPEAEERRRTVAAGPDGGTPPDDGICALLRFPLPEGTG